MINPQCKMRIKIPIMYVNSSIKDKNKKSTHVILITGFPKTIYHSILI